MGGSGGGSSSTPYKGSTRDIRNRTKGEGEKGINDPCLDIFEQLRLQSPKPKVIENLKVGDELRVTANNGKPPINVITQDGDVAGSIQPSSGKQLLDCMENGFEYSAVVDSLLGGVCVVNIKLKGV